MNKCILGFILTFCIFTSAVGCPTCIGNLEDENTPSFFSPEMYQQPNITPQAHQQALEEIFGSDEEENQTVQQVTQ